jgi:hypothetical protein
MAWSEDTSGVQRKPPPDSFGLNLTNFTQALDWVRDHIYKHYGYRVMKVLHDAYPNIWRCYDEDGEIIVNIEHALMARLALALDEIDYMLTAQEVMEYEEELRERYGEVEEDDGA